MPSNFDPTHLAVHDSAPEGGIDWTNPPDASCENSQTLAQCLPMVNPGAVEAYNAASVTMSDGTLASIYVVNNFVVESNAVLNLSSDPYNPYPVIIAAKGTVQILGTINGYGGVVGGQAGPGAFPVYNSGDTSLGPGGGAGGPTGSYPSSSPAGGSFCGTGGVGGGVAPLAPPGDTYGTSSLVPLIGGSGGGYYGTTGYNGLGGGALQITSGKSILIGNVGVINMGGGNDYGRRRFGRRDPLGGAGHHGAGRPRGQRRLGGRRVERYGGSVRAADRPAGHAADGPRRWRRLRRG